MARIVLAAEQREDFLAFVEEFSKSRGFVPPADIYTFVDPPTAEEEAAMREEVRLAEEAEQVRFRAHLAFEQQERERKRAYARACTAKRKNEQRQEALRPYRVLPNGVWALRHHL